MRLQTPFDTARRHSMRPVSRGRAKVPRLHAHGAPVKAVPFENDHKSCSQMLFDLMQGIPTEGMSLRGIIHYLGERGLLMVCMVFTLPSLVPIPIPGMSIPQGLLITLIGLGLVFNRAPILPTRLLEYRMGHRNMFMILEKGTRLFARIEKLSYPRLNAVTEGYTLRTLNGLLLVGGALMLMAPFPIPFSNVLPAYGILFLAFGIMQRDGWMVVGGYLMLVLTVLYVYLVFFFGLTWIQSLFA